MNWINGTWAVLEKDLRLEMRSRYALNMLLMFVIASLILIAFAIGDEPVTPQMRSGLLWIIIFFSASIGLARSFVAEEERGTVLLLRLNVRGSMVYAGKLIFNYLMLLGVDVIATFLFVIILDLDVAEPLLLIVILALGSLGLAGATTLLSAIIARASNQGPLLPVLLFPILMPLLMTVVPATRTALEGGAGWAGATADIRVMAAFSGVVITAAVLLFDYVWED